MTDAAPFDLAISNGLLDAWGIGAQAHFTPLGNGLIHRTLLVEDAGQRRVLQCLNTHVFRDPALLMRNCQRVTAHLGHERAAGRYDYAVLELVPTRAGEPAAVLADGSWWRMFAYVPDTFTHDAATTPQVACEAARAFGAFATALANLPPGSVGDVIPHFHDPVTRFAAFRAALQADRVGRANRIGAEIDAALSFESALAHWQTLLDAGLPRRIAHNDCKLNNVLFDRSDAAVCIVDLDTVMAGSLLFDFGDLCRSTLSATPEDATDLARIAPRPEFFAALARGYAAGCGDLLAPIERANLAFAARLVTGVVGLRFLTDYLNGDRYFRIAHATHNLERARNQLALYATLTAAAAALQARITD